MKETLRSDELCIFYRGGGLMYTATGGAGSEI